MKRNKTLKKALFRIHYKAKEYGYFYNCADTIDKCYDYQIPYILRIKMIGKILPQVRKVVSMDKELLVWAASARWLSRSKAFSLAAMALSEYRALSLRLSQGAQQDVLNIMGELLERDWYTKYSTEPEPISTAS